jgi:tRNA-Thr(GGU) m(6)t(6)A37 methyltransferase TsaA
MTSKLLIAAGLVGVVGVIVSSRPPSRADVASRPVAEKLIMEPIGTIHKKSNDTWIEVDRRFEDGLLGLDDFSHVWVFWWFDRNDTPGKRRILQVHPRGNSRNPLTGVFATRAPVRPNLVALTLCRVRSVERNKVRVAGIDAFDGTPVIDLKPYIPSIDDADDVTLPRWLEKDEQP